MTACWCGQAKRAEQPFCWECWTDLLPSQRAVLKHPESARYAEFYAEACKWLDRP